jgi:predicted neuraminidase
MQPIMTVAAGLAVAAAAAGGVVAGSPDERLVFPLQDLHVHSSCLVEAANGDLLVCWFEGSGERTATDVRIRGARLAAGGDAWTAPLELADTPDFPDLNPVLFIDPEQRLWLFWIVVPAERWEDSLLKYRVSDDYLGPGPPRWRWQDAVLLKPAADFQERVASGVAGEDLERFDYGRHSVSPIDSLVEAAGDPSLQQRGWMPRNHLLVLPTGRWLLPLYSDGFYVGLMAISDDRGATWRAGGPIPGVAINQPAVVRRRDGTLVAFMRREGRIPPLRVQVSSSADDGETWTVAESIDVPNPNASLEVIALADGRWVMIFNDLEEGRDSLAVALSEDEGRTWPHTRRVEHLPGGEFHYPSIIQTADGRIHATYTYQPGPRAQKAIKHLSLDADWIRDGAGAGESPRETPGRP